jgi:hypothetical protein
MELLGTQSFEIDGYRLSLPIETSSVASEPLHQERFFTESEAFREMVRNFPHMRDLVDLIPVRRSDIQSFLHLIHEGDWELIRLHYLTLNLDFLALDAFLSFYLKKIEIAEFCTTLFFYYALKEYPKGSLRVLRLYEEDGSENDEAIEIIESTFDDRVDLDEFFDSMVEKSPSESVFFFLPSESREITKNQTIKERILDVLKGEITITDEIADATGMNYLHLFEFEGEKYQMIPSFSMMQEFINALGKKSRVRINPTFGLSTLHDICKNGLNGSRDMGFYFPPIQINHFHSLEISLPDRADGFLAPTKLDFLKHDFYHAVRACDVPEKFRIMLIEIAHFIKEIKLEFKEPLLVDYLSEFYERLIDMEHLYFSREELAKLPEEEKYECAFFLSLEDAALRALDKSIISQFFAGEPFSNSSILKRFISIPLYLKGNKVFQTLAERINASRVFVDLKIDKKEMHDKLNHYYHDIEGYQSVNSNLNQRKSTKELTINSETKPFSEWLSLIIEKDSKFIFIHKLFLE